MEPLYYLSAPTVEPDDSLNKTIHFISENDHSQQALDIYYPPVEKDLPLPLVIAPHAITWTARQDYHGGLPGLNRTYHRGYYNLASKYNVTIAMPHGHHHSSENSSLANPPHIQDMACIPEILAANGFSVDRGRIYVCGLSMGGLEALVLAGQYPGLIAAAVAFNPIVDLAAWQEDMENSPLPEIKEFGTAENISAEVGGRPADVPRLYKERSVFPYIEGLAHVPTLIFWSNLDIIVPRQRERHTYQLYLQVKAVDPDSPIVEYNHTKIHGKIDPSIKTRWMLHEWCDYDWALQWLLHHHK
ncbi:MAG: prolyl oligopeptidase family serine peptidase [Anaerolineaceae bacterium]|nr:prolyl oligopeptidase family serine peptidase [Anaerolineaceae bacterium]